jgi:hypothetical protein
MYSMFFGAKMIWLHAQVARSGVWYRTTFNFLSPCVYMYVHVHRFFSVIDEHS